MARLTVKEIEALKRAISHGDTVREFTPDGDALYLRKRKSGALFWERRKSGFAPLSLGPEAIGLTEARRLNMEAALKEVRGVDPMAERRAAKEARKAAREPQAEPEDTFGKVFEIYLTRHARPKLRTADEIERTVRKDAIPLWANRRLSEITRADANALVDLVSDRGSPRQADILRAALRAFYVWADRRGYEIDRNPFDGVARPNTNGPRERVLDDKEIRLLWGVCRDEGWPFGDVTRLLLLMAARKSEVAEGRWEELDLDGGAWKLPKVRVKNGTDHTIQLSEAALEIVRGLPRMEGENGKPSDLIFTTNGRTPISGFSRWKERLDKKIAERNGGEPIPEWTFHDLRRTGSTLMGRLRISRSTWRSRAQRHPSARQADQGRDEKALTGDERQGVGESRISGEGH